MPSASFSLAGTSKRNPLKPGLSAEASNPGHGQGSKVGPSSSWMSSLQHMSSAKWMLNMVIFWFMLQSCLSFCCELFYVILNRWPFVFCCISSCESYEEDSQYIYVKLQMHGGLLASFPKCLVKNFQVIYSWRLQICCKVDKLHSIAPILRPFSVASFLRWL